MKGIFISLEGPDGSGKSTQIEMLRAYLSKQSYEVILTREPGGTRISEKIREIILDREYTEMDYKTEALLYAASRAQHVSELIRPAVSSGKIVVSDRFLDSSLVYQGVGRNLGDAVKLINQLAVGDTMPDITFLLKISPEIGISRTKKTGELDRLELEHINYHKKVYAAYLDIEEDNPSRVKGIDASQSPEQIHREIVGYIDALIKTWEFSQE